MNESVYELWDIPSRNLLWSYDTLEDAIAAVRETIAEDGMAITEGLALIRNAGKGGGGVIAANAELAALATRTISSPTAASD